MPRPESESRIIPLQGGINFRDLGGYRAHEGLHVRWRTLFRSGTTHLLCELDRQLLAEIAIRTVIDLRANHERRQYPHGLLGSPEVRYWSHDHDRTSGNLRRALREPGMSASAIRAAMIDLYEKLPYEFADVFKELFSSACSGPLPLVFNCAAGKDRTGVAAALLLTALGVGWDEVLKDYMLSQHCVPDILRIFGLADNDVIRTLTDGELIPALFGVILCISTPCGLRSFNEVDR